MNSIFTIVAKNYLALALTLGDSVKKYHPEIELNIFLSDEFDSGNRPNTKHNIIEVKEVVKDYLPMAMKYDVIEFSTAVKPFCIEYLMKKGSTKVIYLDPDILLYQRLDDIFKELDNNFAVITPHANNLRIKWDGAVPENNVLLTGIFNLGFIGVSNYGDGEFFIEWWKEKLKYKSFTDKFDGLFYDQKWIDYLPSVFTGKGLKILNSPAYNTAWWNLHEREIIEENGELIARDKLNGNKDNLSFFHFSGYNVYDKEMMCRYGHNENLILKNFPILERMFMEYGNMVIANGHEKLSKMPYKYNYFNNGVQILRYHRRVYKAIVDRVTGYRHIDLFQKEIKENAEKIILKAENPFDVSQGSFYELLEKNKLIVKNLAINIDRLKPDKDSQKFDKKIRVMVLLMRGLKKILGIEKYLMIMKFMELYSRESYQIFLVDEIYKGKNNG